MRATGDYAASESATMIRIRQATPSDAKILSDILITSIRQLCIGDHKNDADLVDRWIANKSPDNIKKMIANPNTVFLVAELNGKPAGVGCYSHDGEILLNYVSPDYRFKGVSRAILDYIISALTDLGLRKATLTSTTTAHKFYSDAGWKDAGEPELYFGLPGYPMEREIGNKV